MKGSFHLTENEKKILKQIIDNAKISDTEISNSMPISQQAVNQMRKRLEDKGVIKGYMPIIDFEKVGIRLLYFAGIKVLPEMWDKITESDLRKKIDDIPFLFFAFRIPSGDISYLLIFGFRNIREQETFTRKLETELSGNIEIIWSYNASVNNMLAYDSLNLVFHSLSKGETNIKKAVEKIIKK